MALPCRKVALKILQGCAFLLAEGAARIFFKSRYGKAKPCLTTGGKPMPRSRSSYSSTNHLTADQIGCVELSVDAVVRHDFLHIVFRFVESDFSGKHSRV